MEQQASFFNDPKPRNRKPLSILTTKLYPSAKMDAMTNQSPTFSASVMDTTKTVDVPHFAKFQQKSKRKQKMLESVQEKDRKPFFGAHFIVKADGLQGQNSERAKKILENEMPKEAEFLNSYMQSIIGQQTDSK